MHGHGNGFVAAMAGVACDLDAVGAALAEGVAEGRHQRQAA
ncbi:MAG: hypothetical protein ABJ011_16385 [Nitratireductor sp.]